MEKLPAQTHIGRVSLKVADLERSINFYQQAIGLRLISKNDSEAELGAADEKSQATTALLRLVEVPGARPPGRTTGLYHFAILTPSRISLSRALVRLAEYGSQARLNFAGASDHGVSEALYLADPDDNGIEIYRDRPRAEWPLTPGGQVAMVSEPLDLKSLTDLSRSEGLNPEMDAGTFIGHVHLHVAHLDPAAQFYVDTLGFDLIQRMAGSALFISAGRYHHHIGLNTWNGVGAPPPAPDAAGLDWFEIRLPDKPALSDLVNHLKNAGCEIDDVDGAFIVQDPFTNRVLLSSPL